MEKGWLDGWLLRLESDANTMLVIDQCEIQRTHAFNCLPVCSGCFHPTETTNLINNKDLKANVLVNRRVCLSTEMRRTYMRFLWQALATNSKSASESLGPLGNAS